MKTRKVTFKIEFDLPEGASVAAAQEYVTDAIVSMCGSLKPPFADDDDPDDDPMFSLDRESVRVTRVRKQ